MFLKKYYTSISSDSILKDLELTVCMTENFDRWLFLCSIATCSGLTFTFGSLSVFVCK